MSTQALRMNLLTEEGGDTAVIELYTYIDPCWGFSCIEVADRLKQLTSVKRIVVRIHSRGGNALEGFAIYTLLRQHPARVEAEIIGVAASAASTVAMAADVVRISDVGFFMIHEPWCCCCGSSAVLRRVADSLDGVRPSIVRAYLRRMKLSADEIAAAMAAADGDGTWYDAEQSVAAGLADELMFDAPAPQNAIDLSRLRGVPQAALELFSAAGGAPGAQREGEEEEDPMLAAVLDVLGSVEFPVGDESTRDDDGEATKLLDLLEQLLSEEEDDDARAEAEA
jgi:ATP-dependent protease ClpP protease subunit